jgi:hypothetical protein
MPDDGLERLRKRLYKKDERFSGRFQEPELPYRRENVRTEWTPDQKKSEELIAAAIKFEKPNKMKVIIIFVAIFVLGIVILAAVYLFGGFGLISSRNIELLVSGPAEAAGGELVRWEVLVRNQNKVKLETAEIVFHYPKGFRPVNKSPGVLLTERRVLGEIQPQAAARETFSAFAFGPLDFEGQAEAALEYRTAGSNAIFEKTETILVKISRSPVGVSINIPKELNVGREINFEIKVVSNAGDAIKDIAVELVYPPGFTFKDSFPEPSEGQNRWQLGDLLPGQKRSVKISGVFEGAESEQRNIEALAGFMENKSLNVYGSASAGVTLRRLFIDLEAVVNSQKSETLAVRSGDRLNVELKWKNNLPEILRNVTLEVELAGEAVDEKSISVNNGFYRGFDKKIIWTPSSLKELQTLEPGAEGRASFSFQLYDVLRLPREKMKNPQIILKGKIYPAEAGPSLAGVDVSGNFEISLKLETMLRLSVRGLYFSGIFPGSGPLPPRVGQETLYAVSWSLANISSDISGLIVRAALPPYLRWKGIISPPGENIVFDAAKSEVVWTAGSLKAGVGILEPAREVMFKIGFVPSPDQVGSSPVLLFDISAEGRDDFTGNIVRASEPSLTIDLLRFDPGLKSGDEKVKP